MRSAHEKHDVWNGPKSIQLQVYSLEQYNHAIINGRCNFIICMHLISMVIITINFNAPFVKSTV
jgi:hypothetical protein